jgi:predicted nucleic acid-binding protein
LAQLASTVLANQADAGLAAHLGELAGEMTDDSPAVSRRLADTSVFIAQENGRTLKVDDLPDQLAVSIVTIGELRAGVLAASTVQARDRRLGTLSAVLGLDPVPVDDAVAAEWARLRVLLRDAGQRIPVNDSWIAATAMAPTPPRRQGSNRTGTDSWTSTIVDGSRRTGPASVQLA